MNAKNTDPRTQQGTQTNVSMPACCTPAGNQPCCEPDQSAECCTPGNSVACCEPSDRPQARSCC